MATELAAREWTRIRQVGIGATAEVWLAHSQDGLTAALKIAKRSEDATRLATEAERLLFVESPYLPRVLDLGRLAERDSQHPGRAYVALEWIPGTSVQPRALPSEVREALAMAVARDIGAALQALHHSGSTHGDVKPQNIVVEEAAGGTWRARLVDFGLSDAVDASTPRGGTLRYLAPEVFRHDVAGGGRSRDLYALGVVLAEIASARVAEASDPKSALSHVLPTAVESLARPLLAHEPAARPTAGWVNRTAVRFAGRPFDSEAEEMEARRASVRRSYLAVRRDELLRAAQHAEPRITVDGTPGSWLEAAVALAQKTVGLRGQLRPSEGAVMADLGPLGRSRWLVHLIGAQAAAWPSMARSDGELNSRLEAAVARHEPRSLVLTDIQDHMRRPCVARRHNAVELAVLLSRVPVDPQVLDEAEASVVAGEAEAASVLILARALRLRGEVARALSVLSYLQEYRARVEKAELLRRIGAHDAAGALLESVPSAAEADDEVRAKRAAVLARMALDRGAFDAARGHLDGAADNPACLEVKALLELACGELEGVEATLAASAVAPLDEEERARFASIRGMLAHARGEHEVAFEAFRLASEHAARAGAVLEEATYRTGEAAAGAGIGRLGEAIAAAERAELLFESLGRLQEAGRAALTRTVVFSQIGALTEAREAAGAALERARKAGDVRCRGFVHLALCDALPKHEADALDHAERARALLAECPADGLHVAARLHACGAQVDIPKGDRDAAGTEFAPEARLDWWRTRAERALQTAPNDADRIVIEELIVWAGRTAPPAVRGPALAAGAELAARVSSGDHARRLLAAATNDARELLGRVPAALRGALNASTWIRGLHAPRPESWAPEQLSEVETLLRALSQRERLRPLLDQVLDALVLWTGVERGLLLVRAPGGRLVPRAARNLARKDIAGPQRELSYSLAERALAEGEPIVAVDAAGELPDLHESVHALQLRSVLAVPLIARGEALGVVYLDDRVRRGAFGPRELAWVRLVASLAAVAIADARDQLLLRRSARRAKRAEAKVEIMLARSEADLDRAERELARQRHARETRFPYEQIVGQSEPLRAMLRVVDRVTMADVPVMLLGESGSGKELIARAIHDNGPRRDHPFVGENCGAIPETLLESALFGHVRGAFTGASRSRAGLFEVADHGTLFLDEIAEMSLGMQTRLLRVLEEGTFRPLGAERESHVDVRVIAATHRNLRELVQEGKFREDLFYRLDVISVRVPPLRERKGDVPLLARHFIQRHAPEHVPRISRAAFELLESFAWPGNVRQLENEVRRALVLADDVIQPEHFSAALRDSGEGSKGSYGLNVRMRVDALERELVKSALTRTSGNQTRAAELLGLSRFGLQKMIKRLGLATPSSGRRRTEPLSPVG